MKPKILSILILVLVIAAIIFFMFQDPRKKENEILVLCGGSMRFALEEIIKEYEKISPEDKILTTYGGSGELMVQIKKTRKGDIFLCHDPFIEWAHKNKYIEEWAPVAYLDVVIAVPKGNPKQIRSLGDLARPGIRLGIGDEKYSTSGVIAGHVFKKHRNEKDIRNNIRMKTKGHQQRASDVSMGSLDATLIWNAVAWLFKKKLDTIHISGKYIDTITSATYKETDLSKIKVAAGIISTAGKRENVRKFYKFAVTEGKKVFNRFGFTPLEKKK